MTRRWCPSAAARPMVKRLPHGFFLLVVLSKCRPESGHQGPTAAADSGGPCAGCSGSRDRKLCGASAQHREAPPVQEAPPTEDQGTAPPPAPWLCAQFLLCGASRCPAARRPVCAQERGSPAGKTDCVPPLRGGWGSPRGSCRRRCLCRGPRGVGFSGLNSGAFPRGGGDAQSRASPVTRALS